MIDRFYLFRGLVYAQSFLWLYLLDLDFDLKKYQQTIFHILMILSYFLLSLTGFSFSQYTNRLLKFYVVLLVYSISFIRILNVKFKSKMVYTKYYSFKDCLCLGFLLVFTNSYYWEFMFHINSILIYGLSFNQIIQALHLIPTLLLYRKLEINNKSSFFKLIIIGLIISDMNLIAYNFIDRFWFYWIPINQMLFNNITRFACLNILIYSFMKYTNLIKKRD